MFVKIALLVLTIRVFGVAHRKTLFGIYSLLTIVVLYYVSGLVVKICICMPISAYWRGETDKCLNQSAIITTDAIISVISDLAILCIPIPLIWSLQMPSKKKLRVIGILCAGGTATAFSIYRLGMIITEGKSTNQTIVFIKVILTGYDKPHRALTYEGTFAHGNHRDAEVGIGLICACLPSATAFFLRRQRMKSGEDSEYPSNKSVSAPSGIFVNRTFHLSAESRSKQKKGDSDGFELIPDQAELMSYAHATRDSSRKSLSL